MWYFDVKYKNNCLLGGHFYTTDEMLSWFKIMLSYYVKEDGAYEIKIWYDKEEEYD